jgi:hypothetical protein
MPHFGQLPGWSLSTPAHIGQKYFFEDGGGAASPPQQDEALSAFGSSAGFKIKDQSPISP